MSDIHLEFNSNKIKTIDSLIPKELNTKDKILLLAGDIGHPDREIYWDFLFSCSERYAHTIFITGNHEYYNDEMDWKSIDKLIEDKEKPSNLHFLSKSKIVIDGITILGATCWTNIPVQNRESVLDYMNDYEYITINTNMDCLTIDKVNLTHKEHVDWLRSEINSPENDKILIMTHHMPTFALIDKKYRKFSKINCAFASDLTELFSPKIKYWVCGHTHSPADLTDEKFGIRFVINPYGYEGDNEVFNVIEFEIL
jgi:UDP-2,3-diacylglucosamine pyrophosphatase LpxH